MPRQIEERLVGYQFGVSRSEAPVRDEQGNVVHTIKGGPKTETEWLLELVDLQPTHVHVVRIPLTRQARDSLVEQLTGGIAIAQPGDVPKPE